MTQDFLWGEVSEGGGGKWRLSLGIQLLMLLNGVKCIVSTYKVCVNPPPFTPRKQRLHPAVSVTLQLCQLIQTCIAMSCMSFPLVRKSYCMYVRMLQEERD